MTGAAGYGFEGDTQRVLTPEVVDHLRRYSREVVCPAQTTLFRRGELGAAFYVVLAGKVEISLSGSSGARLTLARLGKGAFLGEMSLISGEPASADAVVTEPARLLLCPRSQFNCALGESDLLATQIMIGLSRNVRRTSLELWRARQEALLLTTLVDTNRPQGALIAHSAAMRRVNAQLEEAAADPGPVLFSGEQGTGKLFLAAMLHRLSPRGDHPCIVVDCRDVPREAAGPLLFGSVSGAPGEPAPPGPSPRDPAAALQAANGGTLVLRHVDALPKDAQAQLASYLARQRDQAPELRPTRIVATSRVAAETLLGDAGAIVPELRDQLRERVIEVPGLSERLKDVIPLAKEFLREKGGPGRHHLDQSARRLLLSHRYSQRHATELREAIETAVSLAEDGRVGAEHLFFGSQHAAIPYDLEIGRSSAVRRLLHGPFLPAVRWGMTAVLAAVIAACLAWPDAASGQWANAMVWVVWEPAVFMLFFFTGRLWCGICPLSTAGRWAAKAISLGRALPNWLQTSTGLVPIAGFLAIIWAEWAFSLPDSPRATAVFLLYLVAVVLISALVFSRETWCRHLCPLGWYGAMYASGAAVAVKANPQICTSICVDHPCFTGPDGCPTFHLPFHSRSSYNCKQCFRCLEVCPHGSASLYLRPPFHMIWRWNNLSEALKGFALFVIFFSPMMYASLTRRWLHSNWQFAGMAIVAVYGALVARQLLGQFFAGPQERDGDSPLVSRIILAFAVLAWGPAMAYQFNHVAILETVHFVIQPPAVLSFVPRLDLSLRWLLEIAAVVWAGIFAAVCCVGIASVQRRQADKLLAPRWVALFLLAALYFASSVLLIWRA